MRLIAALYILLTTHAGAEFRYRINEDLGTLDWGHGEVPVSVVTQLMEGLTTSGPQGEAVPALAHRWVYSKGKKEITFFIRENAVWSDGVAVCAKHFVDAWVRALSPTFASPFAHLFFEIKNASAFNEGRINDNSLLGARAEGCKKLVVTFEKPVGFLPELVSHWVFFPIRLDVIEKHGRKWTMPENLAVTGPYTLAEWKRDVHFLLKRNPRYFGKPARVDTLRALVIGEDQTALSLFKAGGLDWNKDIPHLEKVALAKSPSYKTFQTWVGYHLGFKMFEGGLSKEQRCLLARALKKTDIPKFLNGNETPAWGIFPPTLGPNTPKNFDGKFDVKAVKKIFEGVKLKVHYYAKDIHFPLIDWIQGQWEKHLDLDLETVRMEGKAYWGFLRTAPPQIFLSGITAAHAHPHSFASEFLSSSTANWGKFRSKAYDSFAEKLSTTERTQITSAQIQKLESILLHQECAVVPLYFRQTSVLVKPYWKGFFINPLTYAYLKEVHR